MHSLPQIFTCKYCFLNFLYCCAPSPTLRDLRWHTCIVKQADIVHVALIYRIGGFGDFKKVRKSIHTVSYIIYLSNWLQGLEGFVNGIKTLSLFLSFSLYLSLSISLFLTFSLSLSLLPICFYIHYISLKYKSISRQNIPTFLNWMNKINVTVFLPK